MIEESLIDRDEVFAESLILIQSFGDWFPYLHS